MTKIDDRVSPLWQATLPNEPLLVLDSRVQEMSAAFTRREEVFAALANMRSDDRPRYSTVGNNAIIPVVGPLLNWGEIDLSYYGYTSYGWLISAFNRAAADVNVHRAVLFANSPGGVVDGIEAATESLRNLKAAKPVVAHVEGLAASAAYWLVAQADFISMTDLSEIGHIGVYTSHLDYSKLFERIGVKVSLIASGRHKVEGNPYEPLPETVREEMQARVDDLRLAFAEEVAAGRGDRLSVEAALATEARMYRGRVRKSKKFEAIENGLADTVGTLNSTLSGATTARSVARPGTKGASMSGQEKAADTAVSKADHDNAVTAARGEGQKLGATAERDRFKAVSASEHFAGREKAAHHMLLTTDMSAEAITGVLANLPKESVQASAPAAPAGARAKDAQGGLVTVAEAPPQAPAASWNKSVERINSRVS